MARILSRKAGVSSLCAAVTMLCGSALSVSAQEDTRASSPATAHSDASTTIQSLPIFYDAALATQGFPNPLVKARIGGHEAIFIVDSGAAVHVLADWYVAAAGIPTEKSESQARGSGGKNADTRLVRGLQGHWSDGQRLSLNEAIAVAFPPYFESNRLGGLVSPQLLAPGGMATVLDLRIPSLQIVPFARALSDLRRSKAPTIAPDLTQSCRNAGSKLVNRLYVAPGTVAGITEPMLIDTGATGTFFSDKSRIAQAIGGASEPGPRSEGVGGERNGSRLVRNVQLLRGGRPVTLDAGIAGVSESCESKGELGMDALRSCVLILGENEAALSCD